MKIFDFDTQSERLF